MCRFILYSLFRECTYIITSIWHIRSIQCSVVPLHYRIRLFWLDVNVAAARADCCGCCFCLSACLLCCLPANTCPTDTFVIILLMAHGRRADDDGDQSALASPFQWAPGPVRLWKYHTHRDLIIFISTRRLISNFHIRGYIYWRMHITDHHHLLLLICCYFSGRWFISTVSVFMYCFFFFCWFSNILLFVGVCIFVSSALCGAPHQLVFIIARPAACIMPHSPGSLGSKWPGEPQPGQKMIAHNKPMALFDNSSFICEPNYDIVLFSFVLIRWKRKKMIWLLLQG